MGAHPCARAAYAIARAAAGGGIAPNGAGHACGLAQLVGHLVEVKGIGHAAHHARARCAAITGFKADVVGRGARALHAQAGGALQIGGDAGLRAKVDVGHAIDEAIGVDGGADGERKVSARAVKPRVALRIHGLIGGEGGIPQRMPATKAAGVSTRHDAL